MHQHSGLLLVLSDGGSVKHQKGTLMMFAYNNQQCLRFFLVGGWIVRRELGKAVRDRFRKQMGLRFSGFKEDRGAEVPTGWQVFGLEIASDLAVYIILAIFPGEDRFTIEGAWTRNGRFPADVRLLWPKEYPEADVRRDDAYNGDFRFRLATLWQPRDRSWDLVPPPSLQEFIRQQNEMIRHGKLPEEPPIEEALGKVDVLVDDAMAKIDEYLLPYFDQIAVESAHTERVSELAKR
ncbi:MAG TPA: hypothetical protein VHP11_08585 [Tepidisphaeraceae bacterium]|nr:hypothetical protein [Tepidisphaeraceae bacterium]